MAGNSSRPCASQTAINGTVPARRGQWHGTGHSTGCTAMFGHFHELRLIRHFPAFREAEGAKPEEYVSSRLEGKIRPIVGGNIILCHGRVSTARVAGKPSHSRAVVEGRKSPTERARHPCHGCRGTVATVTGGNAGQLVDQNPAGLRLFRTRTKPLFNSNDGNLGFGKVR
ncbi:hypothetical protein B0H13DRAFT_1852163 [Mycena leptocephala]|nr:hypothetical protein B0H13DRAFT_1852163 [Mycena leptocephala]